MKKIVTLGMEQTWNDYNLKPPPFITVRHNRTGLLKDLTDAHEALKALTKTIQQMTNCQHLDNEIFLLSRLIYKVRNNLGRQKVAQGMRMVKKCLERWKSLKMVETLEPLKEDFRMLSSVTTSNEVYLQSALCMKYILKRILGSAVLLGQTTCYSMHTFICAYQNLLQGLFIPKMLTFMALMSRIRILCLMMMMQPLFQCYKCGYQLLLQVYGAEHVAGLPDSLEDWMKDQGYCISLTSHLDNKSAKPSNSLDSLLSKYAARDDLEDNIDIMDVLNDPGIANTDQDVSEIKSEFDKQMSDVLAIDKPPVPSSGYDLKVLQADVVPISLLNEDLGMKVGRTDVKLARTEHRDLVKSHESKCLVDAISRLPKCTSHKKLEALLMRIRASVPMARRKCFKSLLQELRKGFSIQTEKHHKGLMAYDVELMRKKVSSFIQSLVEDAKTAANIGQETVPLPSENKGKKKSKQTDCDKKSQQLTSRYLHVKKLWNTAIKKRHNTKKLLELLLKVKKDAKIYQPLRYKKILNNLKLGKNKETLSKDICSLLKGTVTAMEEKLTQQSTLEENFVHR